mmetsp:Transcript_33589/g.33039  ORF Transcript_33589/g.33039 Transcript_33589/m.33039 type:complete len:271 (+) Transcript_33589:57-869(+)
MALVENANMYNNYIGFNFTIRLREIRESIIKLMQLHFRENYDNIFDRNYTEKNLFKTIINEKLFDAYFEMLITLCSIESQKPMYNSNSTGPRKKMGSLQEGLYRNKMYKYLYDPALCDYIDSLPRESEKRWNHNFVRYLQIKVESFLVVNPIYHFRAQALAYSKQIGRAYKKSFNHNFLPQHQNLGDDEEFDVLNNTEDSEDIIPQPKVTANQKYFIQKKDYKNQMLDLMQHDLKEYFEGANWAIDSFLDLTIRKMTSKFPNQRLILEAL